MSRTVLERRIRQVAKAMHADLIVEALRLASSGAVDVAEAGNDYTLPKALLAVACERQAAAFVQHPTINQYRRNLRHF